MTHLGNERSPFCQELLALLLTDRKQFHGRGDHSLGRLIQESRDGVWPRPSASREGEAHSHRSMAGSSPFLYCSPVLPQRSMVRELISRYLHHLPSHLP